MKSAIFAATAAIAGLAIPQPAVAQDAPAVFKPAGQWALDYGDDYCRLARSFSDGKNDLALAIERIEPGPLARLILVSDAIKPFRSADEIGWHFTPADPERKARYTHSTTADGKQYYNLGPFALAPLAPPAPGSSPPPFDRSKEQAAAKALNGFVLDNGLNTPVQVDTGDLSAPIAALPRQDKLIGFLLSIAGFPHWFRGEAAVQATGSQTRMALPPRLAQAK